MIPFIFALLQDAAAPVVEKVADAAPVVAEKVAEVAPEAAASGTTLEMVLKYAIPVLGIVVTLFLVPWLRKMSKKASLEAGATLFDRVQGFVFRRVGDIVEENYPKIAAIVVKDGLDAEKIKALLYDLGAELKTEAVTYFKTQGVDLIKEMGDDALDKIIRSAANKLSPFPGKETAVALAESTVSNMIVDKGVDYVRDTWLND